MMTLAIHDQRLAKPGPQDAALRDYDSVRRAIAFISERWRNQPTIEAVADAASVTPDELHHLLRDSASVLDAALDSGLSGPGRLHDLFVTHEAMSPGEWKNGGAGMTLRYGFHPSPFGTAIVIASERGPAGLAQRIFDTRMWRADQPLRVVLIGTDFEVRVWETLLKIPMGRAVCYQ